jgi:hypothetical protein
MAARRGAAMVVAVSLTLGACAGRRIVDGIYRAPTGYQVRLPGAAWVVAEDSRADLELRHRTETAGMLVNAACDPVVARRDPDVLARHLAFGLRDRTVVEAGEIPVNGRVASHRVLEGRMRPSDERVRVESYTLTSERCVYDLLYVAEPSAFDTWRDDFRRFVDSFTAE